MTEMNDLNENLGRLTRQMTYVLRNQDRIIESNERSAESLLQIQRMIFPIQKFYLIF